MPKTSWPRYAKPLRPISLASVFDATEKGCQLGIDAESQRINQTHDPFLSMPLRDGNSGKVLVHQVGEGATWRKESLCHWVQRVL